MKFTNIVYNEHGFLVMEGESDTVVLDGTKRMEPLPLYIKPLPAPAKTHPRDLVNPQHPSCKRCHGTGHLPSSKLDCPRCNGTGLATVMCPDCQGFGEATRDKHCRRCGGMGVILSAELRPGERRSTIR